MEAVLRPAFSPSELKVHVHNPYDASYVYETSCPSSSTLGGIKKELCGSYSGTPECENIILTLQGQVLTQDSLILESLTTSHELRLTLLFKGGSGYAEKIGLVPPVKLPCFQQPSPLPHTTQVETFLKNWMSQKPQFTRIKHGFSIPNQQVGVRPILTPPVLEIRNPAPVAEQQQPAAADQGAQNEEGFQEGLDDFQFANLFNLSLFLRLSIMVVLILGANPGIWRSTIVIGFVVLYYLYNVGLVNYIFGGFLEPAPEVRTTGPLSARQLCERFVIGFFASLNPAWTPRRLVTEVILAPEDFDTEDEEEEENGNF